MIFLEQLLVYRCYTDNNTICLEGCGNVIGNLLPILSLQVHCYPECTAKVRPRYKKKWQPKCQRKSNSHTRQVKNVCFQNCTKNSIVCFQTFVNIFSYMYHRVNGNRSCSVSRKLAILTITARAITSWVTQLDFTYLDCHFDFELTFHNSFVS